MSAIALRNVGKHWTTAQGVVHAVHDLTFSLAAGTLNVLLGPSGCGKSTTLRLIAGLESADSGTTAIDGREVARLPPAQRTIAMVFQSYALFPHLSVAENIVFGLWVRNVSARERDRRLARGADLLGLAALGYDTRNAPAAIQSFKLRFVQSDVSAVMTQDDIDRLFCLLARRSESLP